MTGSLCLCVPHPVILEAFQISALAMLLQEATAGPHQHVGGGDSLSILPERLENSGYGWFSIALQCFRVEERLTSG